MDYDCRECHKNNIILLLHLKIMDLYFSDDWK